MRSLVCAVAVLLGFAVDPASASPARRRAVSFPPPCSAAFTLAAHEVTGIAVDQSYLYFGDNDGNIRRAPKIGGASEVLAAMPGTSVIFVAADARSVYFLSRNRADNADSVYAVPKSGGNVTLLTRDLFIFKMIPDGEWLYLAYPGTGQGSVWNPDGRILRVRTDGSVIETLARSLHGPVGLVIDGEDLYFSERGLSSSDMSGGIRRMPKEGGAVTSVATLPGAMMLTHSAGELYALRVIGSDLGAIDAVSKADGSVTSLLSGIRFEVFDPLLFFGDWLYFGNLTPGGTARLEAFRPETGERRTIAEITEGGYPEIAIDRCGVYYSTAEGIERAAP